MNHQTIIEAVANEYHLSEGDIYSTSRLRSFVEARGLIVYLLRKKLQYTYMKISAILHRHYSTLIHAHGLTMFLIEHDSDVRNHYDNITKMLA
jgi:chromosomal replication initiation ATPase DnaA